MVFDNIKNAEKYEILNENFTKAFGFLKRGDLASLAVGKYEIDGKNVYAMVQEYETKDLKDAKYEAHEEYIDIQYMIDGTENMGCADVDKLSLSSPYNKENDFKLLDGEANFIPLSKDEFFIFFTEEAHMPGIARGTASKVRKVVVKIKA